VDDRHYYRELAAAAYVRGALPATTGQRRIVAAAHKAWWLLAQSYRQRSNPVPTKVIDRMLSRWTVPDSTKAHQVDWIADNQVVSANRDG